MVTSGGGGRGGWVWLGLRWWREQVETAQGLVDHSLEETERSRTWSLCVNSFEHVKFERTVRYPRGDAKGTIGYYMDLNFRREVRTEGRHLESLIHTVINVVGLEERRGRDGKNRGPRAES
jgi:hypothetical protein